MKINLYEPFMKWYHGGTIYLYSDTHFQTDNEMEEYFGWPSAEERLEIINKYVTKNDTFVCLGDVGNRLDLISKIKCDYKVLITGNHDKGNANYQRKILECGVCYSEQEAKDILRHGNIHALSIGNVNPDSYEKRVNIHGKEFYLLKADNRLFDKIYDGPLFISDKILLSHERIDLPFCINIHGHEHSAESWINLVEIETTIGLVQTASFNIASDVVDFKPIRLDEIINKYPLKNVPNIHRITIDNARRSIDAK